MKVWKYDRYVENLEESISKVEKAIKQGALLTDMELFDFYFKQFLYGESYNFLKGIRDLVYRTAKYSADMFDELQNIRKNGYNNEEATDYIKSICRSAVTRKVVNGSYRVRSYDENGVLYFELYLGRECEHVFEVTGIKSLTETALVILSLMVSVSTDNLELKSFYETYIISVFNDVMTSKKPTPYVYEGKAKTLRSYMNRQRVSAEPAGKIVQFKVG